MFAVGMAPTPEIAAAVGEAVDLVKAGLAPWESARTYFNFSERPIGGARLYPLKTYTYQRLRKIRATHDPSEMFVSNHPIPPAVVVDTSRISSAPLFADLPAAELEGLAAAMGEAEVDAGTEVVTVDESGSTVYLIEEGEAEVIGAGGPTPVVLGPGDTFGEIALLLTAGQRTATVVARTPTEAPRALRPRLRTHPGTDPGVRAHPAPPGARAHLAVDSNAAARDVDGMEAYVTVEPVPDDER